MKLLISPAKSLNLKTEIHCQVATAPIFLHEKIAVEEKLKKLKPSQIAKTFSLSENLAKLNYERYQNLSTKENLKNSRQAIFTFDGDVYNGFDAYSLNKKHIDFAQKTIRILSGLYGILKPFDLIEPYRLEMGSKISIGKKKNLYQYWTEYVTASLNEELNSSKSNVLVNLASNEYFKVIDTKKLSVPVLNIDFLEEDKKQFKNISFYSKKARGLVARYIVEHNISNMEDIKEFDSERYCFNPKLSLDDKFVFTRKYSPIGKK